MVINYYSNEMVIDSHWIDLLGKIFTGKPWVLTMKLVGLSGENFPIIQFYDGDGDWLLIVFLNVIN